MNLYNIKMEAVIGALRQEKRFNVISNNLSNSQTIGFKKDIPLFRNILHRSLEKTDLSSQDMNAISFRQGDFQKTGRELDLAIDGDGFFKVNTPMGIRYTRAGNFKLDRNKVLTNAEGFPILGKRGVIRIDGQNVTVESNGTLIVNGSPIDQVQLVTFKDLRGLKKVGNNLFLIEGQKEDEIEEPRILQGFLENSNVNSIEEMIQLMDAFRTYESCIKVIQSQDEMDSRAVNDLGRIR
jgi:flagellar basal-body rod protein FlgG